MLILPIASKWFDMILRKEKLEEYRDIKPYYTSRFKTIGLLDSEGKPRPLTLATVILRNGYSSSSRQMIVDVRLSIKEGRPEWGAEPGVQYYCLKIHAITEVQNVDESLLHT